VAPGEPTGDGRASSWPPSYGAEVGTRGTTGSAAGRGVWVVARWIKVRPPVAACEDPMAEYGRWPSTVGSERSARVARAPDDHSG